MQEDMHEDDGEEEDPVNKNFLTVAALLAGLSTTTLAVAQDYPNKPITLLVPAAAGGPSDTVARLVASAMSAELGQQVLVENMGGAGGSLGSGTVAQAAPDGYTLLLYHIGVATFSALYPDLPYNPAEFTSVGLITEVPMTLVGRKELPPGDISELVAYLKENGDQTTFGTAGVGAVSHLCGMLLSEALGTTLTNVPYQGSGPAMTDLIGGRIDLMCDQTTNTTTQIKAGEIKPYAVTTRERIAVLPDLPTLTESGLDGFEISAWHALWAPAGTPEDIRLKLSEALQVALTDATLIERFAGLGTAPVPPEMATPAALDERFSSEIDRLGALIAALPAN